MCVAVTLVPGTNLLLDEIERMHKANADGVGVAWAWDNAVHWSKTQKVNPEEVLEMLSEWIDCPRLVHFRFATAGGNSDELCHPFEISERSICTPEGKTASTMMIHNGHWHRWQEIGNLLKDEGLLPDAGPWSDSRLAAFLASQDMDWLQALGGRVATLTPDGTLKRMGDWTEWKEGIFVSNKSWEHCTVQRGGYAGYNRWSGWHGTNPNPNENKTDSEKGKDKSSTSASETFWDGDTGEVIAFTELNPDKPEDKNGKTAKKNKRGQSHDWFNRATKRWERWDMETETVLDVTSEYRQGS